MYCDAHLLGTDIIKSLEMKNELHASFLTKFFEINFFWIQNSSCIRNLLCKIFAIPTSSAARHKLIRIFRTLNLRA